MPKNMPSRTSSRFDKRALITKTIVGIVVTAVIGVAIWITVRNRPLADQPPSGLSQPQTGIVKGVVTTEGGGLFEGLVSFGDETIPVVDGKYERSIPYGIYRTALVDAEGGLYSSKEYGFEGFQIFIEPKTVTEQNFTGVKKIAEPAFPGISTDYTPPIISHTAVSSVSSGQAVKLTFTATDAISKTFLKNPQIRWRVDRQGVEQGDWNYEYVSGGDGRYELTIPATALAASGTLVYRIMIEDLQGNQAIAPVLSEEPYRVAIQAPIQQPTLSFTPATTCIKVKKTTTLTLSSSAGSLPSDLNVTSSNSQVVRITKKSLPTIKVRGIKTGQATITATSDGSRSATAVITVVEAKKSCPTT